MELYSAMKKKNPATCDHMEYLESIMLSEISQRNHKYHAISLIYGLYKTRQRKSKEKQSQRHR